MILCHGNRFKVLEPGYGVGDIHRDFGSGFYTTPKRELGMEWAMSAYSNGGIGYLHTFTLDFKELKVLNIVEMDSLHWVAELFYNRYWNEEGRETYRDIIDAFIGKYKLDTKGYDIIVGYRADDSYFTYAEDFVRGAIYKETFEKVLRSSQLGIQVCVKSRKAFSKLVRVGIPEEVSDSYSDGNSLYKVAKYSNSSVKKKESIYIIL